MSAKSKSNLYLGGGFILFAIILVAIWIPLDTDSGIVVKSRGRFNIGDALAPNVAAFFLLVGGLLLTVFERSASDQPAMTKNKLVFILRVMAVVIISLLIMRYTGPLLAEIVNLFRTEPIEYRLLRATPGWKHIGFVIGGTMLVTGVISVVERRFSRRALVTGILAVTVLIAVFDLPFEDLQLPPNGDV